MARLEVRTNFCTFVPRPSRSGPKPGCSCGWVGNITFGSEHEARASWASYHKPTTANEHDTSQDGIFVLLLRPEQTDPDRPRLDPPAEWNCTPPPRSNPALRRGDEGVSMWPR